MRGLRGVEAGGGRAAGQSSDRLVPGNIRPSGGLGGPPEGAGQIGGERPGIRRAGLAMAGLFCKERPG